MDAALAMAARDDPVLDAARDEVRAALVETPGYQVLPTDERRAVARALVRIAHAGGLLSTEAETAPQSPPEPRSPPPVRAMNAGDEYSGTAVDRAAGATRALINAVSFPRFVNELITGVFKAMLEANQQQINQYVELIRGVSQSLDGFTTIAGSDAAARNWLAERFPASFAIDAPDPDDGFGAPPSAEDGPPDPPRLRATGPPPSPEAMRAAFGLEPDVELPSGSGEALVPFAKRALARAKQQMLASMVTLGMQRIVIDAGRINAAMRFHIDARSAAREDRGSQFDTRTELAASGGGSFGPFSASASMKSSIGFVSTQDVTTSEDTNASADLSSSVELQFRTDQVPLDRLASEQTVERLKLNTLNPARELELSAQADQARAAARAQSDAAIAARPQRAAAPPLGAAAAPVSPAPAPASRPAAPAPPSPATVQTAAPAPAPAVPAAAPAAAPPARAAAPAPVGGTVAAAPVVPPPASPASPTR